MLNVSGLDHDVDITETMDGICWLSELVSMSTCLTHAQADVWISYRVVQTEHFIALRRMIYIYVK